MGLWAHKKLFLIYIYIHIYVYIYIYIYICKFIKDKEDLDLGYIDDIIFIWKSKEEGLKIL